MAHAFADRHRPDWITRWTSRCWQYKRVLPEKRGRGRQLCRIGAVTYDETVGSWLYPGNTLSQNVLKASLEQLENTLHLDWRRRQQTCIRIDAGFGIDTNLNWLLQQGYQLVAKSQSGRRAGVWGEQVKDWTPLVPERRWVALPEKQIPLCRPTRTIAVRWLNHQGELKHALYVVTDLTQPITEVARVYDLRAGLEVDIREDKQGLLLSRRRKRQWYAQEMLVLLNDLAHNFLIAFRRDILADTPLANFGLYRLVQDVLNVPGLAHFDDQGFVTDLWLLQSHPYAHILVDVLPRLWQ